MARRRGGHGDGPACPDGPARRRRPAADDAGRRVHGADHGIERGVEQDYQRGLAVAEARAEDVLVAGAMNGAPLPAQHGFPVRLVVPGWYGMGNVKWLVRITVATERFEGTRTAPTGSARSPTTRASRSPGSSRGRCSSRPASPTS